MTSGSSWPIPRMKGRGWELSVHYFNTKQTGSRMQLVDWMIEHHPESPLHSLLSMTVSPSRDGGGGLH